MLLFLCFLPGRDSRGNFDLLPNPLLLTIGLQDPTSNQDYLHCLILTFTDGLAEMAVKLSLYGD